MAESNNEANLQARIDEQEKKLASRVRQAVPKEIVDKYWGVFESAQTDPGWTAMHQYKQWKEGMIYASVPLDRKDKSCEEATSIIQDEFLKDDKNREAAAAVARDPLEDPLRVIECSARKLKPLAYTDRLFEHGLRPGTETSSVIVIIALRAMKPDDGFYIALEPGEAFCVDGKESFVFSGKGEVKFILLGLATKAS